MKLQNLFEMYSAYVLTDTVRDKLLKLFPPKYPDVIAHHVTYEFGVGPDANIPDGHVEVVGHVDDGKSIEALVVAVNGQTKRPDGKTFHITWSLNRSKGRKPVDSNSLIEEQGWRKLPKPIRIQTTTQILK